MSPRICRAYAAVNGRVSAIARKQSAFGGDRAAIWLIQNSVISNAAPAARHITDGLPMTSRLTLLTATTLAGPALILGLWATTPSAQTQGTGCAADNFIQHRAASGNAGLPAPQVQAGCSAQLVTVTSNGIPGYAFQQKTPTPLQATTQQVMFPRYPQIAAQATKLGKWVGVTLTGLRIDAANMGPVPRHQAFGDAVANGVLDACGGHTNPHDGYHNHAALEGCITGTTGGREQLIGYALDGFPIYTSAGCLDAACTQVAQFRSGWVATGDVSRDAWNNYQYAGKRDATTLDQCNGRTGPDGTYRYHATDTFPYTIGCFAGTPVMDVSARGSQGGGTRRR